MAWFSPFSRRRQKPTRVIDDDMQSLSEADLRHRVRVLEAENRRLMGNHGQIISECNRRVEMHLNEIRMLKDSVAALKFENTELRQLCCFLDDDRQRAKKIGREWHRFGRYTSSVMKQEVVAYKDKLQELEKRQDILVNENTALKQRCSYFLSHRQNRSTEENPTSITAKADVEADLSGRSSDSENMKPESDQKRPSNAEIATHVKEELPSPSACSRDTEFQHISMPSLDDSADSSQSLMDHMKLLEQRIMELEHDRQPPIAAAAEVHSLEVPPAVMVTSATSSAGTTTYGGSSSGSESVLTAVHLDMDEEEGCGAELRSTTLTPIDEESDLERSPEPRANQPTTKLWRSRSDPTAAAQKPAQRVGLAEAVKVLRIQEALSAGRCVLSQSERALIRQMCHIAWEALEAPPSEASEGSSASAEKLRMSEV